MSTITFETFKFVERLEKAGMTREQSAAIVEAQRGAFAEALDSSLATRADLSTTKSDLKAEFAALRSDMKAMKLRLTIKLDAFVTIAAGVIIAVMRLPR